MAFEVEGGRELARKIDALGKRFTRKLLLRHLRIAAEPIRRRAAERAPRSQTAPHLADNITIGVKGGSKLAMVAIGPSAPFFYGRFQEFGTSHHAAQPFLRPALDSAANEAIDTLADELWWALR